MEPLSGVAVPQEDELLLLASPEGAHTLSVEFDDSQIDGHLVEDDEAVITLTFVINVSKCEQGGGIGEDGRSPGGVVLVGDEDAALAIEHQPIIEAPTLLQITSINEVVLVQLESHSNTGGHHLCQYLRVGEHPLIGGGGDAQIPFEKGMHSVEKGLSGVGVSIEGGVL